MATDTAQRLEYLEEQLERTTQLAERLLDHLFPSAEATPEDVSENSDWLKHYPDYFLDEQAREAVLQAREEGGVDA